MSAISIPAPVDLEVVVRPRPAVIGLPGNVLFPPATVRPRRRTRARAANLFATLLLNGMILTLFGVATYVASGFVGNVQLEAANRDAIRSMDRANAATLSEGGLRHAVENLNSDETVSRWANFNRFKPQYILSLTPRGAPKK